MNQKFFVPLIAILPIAFCNSVYAQEPAPTRASQSQPSRAAESEQTPARRTESAPQEATRPGEPGPTSERVRAAEAARTTTRSGTPLAANVDEKPVVTHHKIE